MGDRYVKEKMNSLKYNLGGEQSGHIILGNLATTGDGLLVALEVLNSLKNNGKASKVFSVFKKIPQVLENIKVKNKYKLYVMSAFLGAMKAMKAGTATDSSSQ